MSDNAARAQANRRLAFKLLWVVGGALLFSVALVPLYDVFCDLTGLNGKTESLPAQAEAALKADESRWVTVEFTSSVMPGLAWNFKPTQNRMQVRPGQIMLATFEASNMTNRAVTGRAVPSLSPGRAISHFKKIECFCFQQQELKAGETRQMPLRFYVSPDLPRDIRTVTLSYAFYSATAAVN